MRTTKSSLGRPNGALESGERTRLQLRLYFQNTFRWYNWGGPDTHLNVQSMANPLLFGKIKPEATARLPPAPPDLAALRR